MNPIVLPDMVIDYHIVIYPTAFPVSASLSSWRCCHSSNVLPEAVTDLGFSSLIYSGAGLLLAPGHRPLLLSPDFTVFVFVSC